MFVDHVMGLVSVHLIVHKLFATVTPVFSVNKFSFFKVEEFETFESQRNQNFLTEKYPYPLGMPNLCLPGAGH